MDHALLVYLLAAALFVATAALRWQRGRGWGGQVLPVLMALSCAYSAFAPHETENALLNARYMAMFAVVLFGINAFFWYAGRQEPAHNPDEQPSSD
jgi:hypothetical protein